MTKTDLYQDVTDRIIAQMEKGVLPWARPWSADKAPFDFPNNAATGNHYSGINILLLWDAQLEGEHSTHSWLTYKQAQSLGGNVRKGERGSTVCYASTFTPQKEKTAAAQEGRDARAIGFLKRYTVFNADQCDGLGDKFTPAEPMPEREMIPAAEAVIAATGADFRHGGNKAFYSPFHDFIQTPHQQKFDDQINYYRTAFHELGHWTGHKSRLDRDLKNGFGSKDYAREELIAEMSAAFSCARLGITPTVRHADYLGSWLKVLKEDKRAIFKAASMASKATAFVMQDTPKDHAQPLQQAA